MPFDATMAVPSTAPPVSRMVTVAPASPAPETRLPAPLIAAVRPTGAVISGAVTWLSGETLPAASAWVSVTIWPFAWAGVSGAVKLPFPSTTAVPNTAPPVPRMVTVAPTSPVPVSVEPSPETVPMGASGAVRSGAMTVAGVEALPAASAWVTCNTCALSCAGVRIAA